MAKARNKRVSPRPTFVCQFRGGEVTRMSHGMLVGQPLPFKAALQGAMQIIGNERGRNKAGPRWNRFAYWPPATDVADSWYEWDGKVYRAGEYTPPHKTKADLFERTMANLKNFTPEQRAALWLELDALEAT